MSYLHQAALSIIEALMVVALTGIMFGFVLPWWMQDHNSVQEAKLAALGGHFAKAVIEVRSYWITLGSPGALQALDGYPIEGIATSVKGWPTDAQVLPLELPSNDPVSRGNGRQVGSNSPHLKGDSDRCLRLWQSLLGQAPSASTWVLPDRDFLVQAVKDTVCRYSYIHNDHHSAIEYDLNTGSVITIL